MVQLPKYVHLRQQRHRDLRARLYWYFLNRQESLLRLAAFTVESQVDLSARALAEGFGSIEHILIDLHIAGLFHNKY